jgi:hypothetical protein
MNRTVAGFEPSDDAAGTQPAPLTLFRVQPAEADRHTRRAVDEDIAAAEREGRLIDGSSGLVAVLRDIADRLDLLRQSPEPKAAYALVAVARSLQDIYRAAGLLGAEDNRDALDKLLDAFGDHARIP